MVLGNGKSDDLFVPTRDVRGRRNPAEVRLPDDRPRGWRCVTQLVERCPDLAERGAIPLAFDAPTGTGAAGTNSSGRWCVVASSDHAVGLLSMTSYGL